MKRVGRSGSRKPGKAPAPGRSVVGVALLAATAVGLHGCVDDAPSPAPPRTTTTPRSVASAPAWVEPTAYSFVLESSCGERALIGRFRVAVAGGRVVRAEGLDESAERAVQLREEGVVPTLGQLVAEARTATEDGAHLVRTDVDPVDGHPRSIRIDREKDAVDEESCYTITDYAVGAAPAPSR